MAPAMQQRREPGTAPCPPASPQAFRRPQQRAQRTRPGQHQPRRPSNPPRQRPKPPTTPPSDEYDVHHMHDRNRHTTRHHQREPRTRIARTESPHRSSAHGECGKKQDTGVLHRLAATRLDRRGASVRTCQHKSHAQLCRASRHIVGRRPAVEKLEMILDQAELDAAGLRGGEHVSDRRRLSTGHGSHDPPASPAARSPASAT
jgi:hypothetical protein